MGLIEIIIIIVSAAIVMGTIIASIIRKRQGKNSCCGSCSSCPYNDKQKYK